MPKNITVQKIIGILLHRLPLIIASGFLVGMIFYIYTSFFIKPVYATSTMIYVQNYGKGGANQNATDDAEDVTATSPAGGGANDSNNAVAQKIFNSDLAGSASLASSCVILFQNDGEVTQWYDGCNVTMKENTFYITISVTGRNPEKCSAVANIVAEKCAESFHNRFAYGTIGTIRKAYTPTQPVSPNKKKNTIIGVGVGVLLACLISVLLELIDTTIKNDDDLTAIYKLPVFAEIPDFESSGR